jgi:hypothetical protein
MLNMLLTRRDQIWYPGHWNMEPRNVIGEGLKSLPDIAIIVI